MATFSFGELRINKLSQQGIIHKNQFDGVQKQEVWMYFVEPIGALGYCKGQGQD